MSMKQVVKETETVGLDCVDRNKFYLINDKESWSVLVQNTTDGCWESYFLSQSEVSVTTKFCEDLDDTLQELIDAGCEVFQFDDHIEMLEYYLEHTEDT